MSSPEELAREKIDALFDFSGHVIPRLALLLFVLCLPREDDRFSLDYFLKR
jgi:hypothetical protein